MRVQAETVGGATMRTLRVEIARPLDCTWDELGTILRVQRKVIPQLMRAGMDARIACSVVGADIAKKQVCPATKGASPQTVVYQAMLRSLEEIKGGKWNAEALAALAMPGGMVSALSQRVMQSFVKRPSFGGSQPIPVRNQELRITIGDDDKPEVSIKLVSKGRTRLAPHASKGSHWATLRAVAEGKLAYGDCKIVLDDRRKPNKWYALISYEPAPAVKLAPDPSRALIVHRGIRNALTLMTTTGRATYEPGAKLSAQLQHIEARMRNARSVSSATRGAGACGHGKARRYEHYETLSGKRDRVCKTFCQQMGAFVAKRAIEDGCALVIIEDYGGIRESDDVGERRALTRFPLYRLKDAIAQSCEKNGLTLTEASCEHVSTTCPACGTADERFHNRRTGIFHCGECSLERPADFIAALHMLRRSDADSSVWDERMSKYETLRKDAAE